MQAFLLLPLHQDFLTFAGAWITLRICYEPFPRKMETYEFENNVKGLLIPKAHPLDSNPMLTIPDGKK